MKRRLKLVPVFLLLVFGAVASPSAMAQRHGHSSGYGHSYGYGWGGGPRFGVSIGFPLFWPGYYPGYYPYAYPGPAYAYPGPAVVPPAGYIEQSTPQTAPAPAQPQGDWYYCATSNAYYPYVRECPGGWQRVPSIPPN